MDNASVLFARAVCDREMGAVRTVWRWVAAGALVLVVLGAVTVSATDPGRRAVRSVQRRFGWGEEGRRARFAALLARASAEFSQAAKGKPIPFGRTEYPVKAELLTHRAEVFAIARDGLVDPPQGPLEVGFLLDLLLSVGGDEAKQVLRTGVESGRVTWIPGYMDAVGAAFSADELKAMALSLKGSARYGVLGQLGTRADQAFLEQFMLAQPDQVPGYDILKLPQGREAALAVYLRLARGAKIGLLQSQFWDRNGPKPDWKAWLEREQDPAVRQWLLYQQGDTPAVLTSLERDGAFPEVQFNWEWERQAIAAYPESFHARGIRAYEQIRGRPYFEIERMRQPGWHPYRDFGNRQYAPDREIPGWLAYLQAYRTHQGADDAAYRLGRSYEIKGQYGEALRWLDAALKLGDGEMRPYARTRIAWILDALLDEAGVRALPADLPADLQPLVAYATAVHELRAGKYAEADRELGALIERWGDQPVLLAWRQADYPFWSRVREQRAQAVRLAELTAVGSWQSRYDMAALMYHDDFVFYNHTWGGGRQYYLREMQNALSGDMAPAYTRWIAGSNNLIQALAVFERLAEAPAPIAEKAAYSRAITLGKLVNYGQDVALWRPITEVGKMGEAALEQFLVRYRKSTLAPDALLSLAYQRGDQALFDRIVREYPDSDAAVTARKHDKQDRLPRASRYTLPFRYLTAEEAPREVTDRVVNAAGRQVSEQMTLGEYTYLLVTVQPPQQRVDLRVWDTADGKIQVEGSAFSDVGGTGYALARIAATQRPVEFKPGG